MKDKSLLTLEFDKALTRVATHADSAAGRALVLGLRPSDDIVEARRRQREAAEARRWLELRPHTSLAAARDIRESAGYAALAGVLDTAMLLDVQATLALARTVKTTLRHMEALLPTLATLARRIAELPRLESEIARCITPRGEIADVASATLATLRQSVRASHDRLLASLDAFIRSPLGHDTLQEPLVTQRAGRYVLPLRAEFRGRVRGIVHDVSASGATLFVEPLSIVDLQNEWREMVADEARECERILRALSALVGANTDAIIENVRALAQLDSALARARYADATRGVEPIFVEGADAELRLTEARHPLLERPVPIGVAVGSEYTALLITGPNTGGKTVALKTTGLTALMAQSGIPILAAEGSQLPVYDGVYADIGDEQSIEQSLSTFSSHLGNIIAILDMATARSLVLLDELGAGTEPGEGAALAQALLETLLERRITTMATTHHGALKAFAQTTPGVCNASVEFDPETLAPTYRLAIGLPGRSNALAIASRLGLPSDVVRRAESHIAPEAARLDDLLDEVQRERDASASLRRQLEAELAEAGRLRQELEERLTQLDAERADLEAMVRREVMSELETTLAQLRRAAALVESGATATELAQAARDLTGARRTVRRSPSRVSDRPRREPERARPLEPGMGVRLRSLGLQGVVASAPDADGEVEVQFGPLRARVNADMLSPTPAAAAAGLRGGGGRESFPYPSPPPGMELHLRGMRVEEAMESLDRYLDAAFRDGLPLVRVVHGKGTGRVRSFVRERLAAHPLVESFRAGEGSEGGEGVTVVSLARRW